MKRMNHLFASVGLTSIVMLAAPAQANEPDPILTEKSTETFDVNLNGLTLALPIELRSRAIPKKISDQATDLSIGNIDISYQLTDAKTNTTRTIKGWVEFEGGKFQCDAAQQLKGIMNVVVKSERDEFKVKRFKSDKFDGYLVTSSHTSRGHLSGVDLKIMDAKTSDCYAVSLAVEDFEAFKSSEIKAALTPLTDAIKKSFTAHADR